MKDLVKLTIDYNDGKTETMVVTKESNAYMTMLEYAEQNDYPIAEEPFLTDKEKNALEVAIDWEIESLECETDGDYADKLKAIKSVKEKLA